MAATFGKRGAFVAQARVAPASAPTYRAAPAAVTAAAARPIADSLPTLRLPVVTVGLLAVLAFIFAAELHYAPGGRLSARTLAAYGAVEGDLIFHGGEWWRLFTAPLLHASWSHLIGNGVVLAIVGCMLEPLIGQRWFAGLFIIGALGGALTSLFVNAPDIPGVGASGAIMGVLGAAFICGSSAKSGPNGRKMQTWALRLILPALIPFSAGSNTDYACHLGGVLTGITTGVLLLMSWERGDDRPAFGNFGAGVGALGLAIGLSAFLLFAGKPGNAAVVADAASGLIPDAIMPEGIDVGTDKARDLVTRYPHDPRAHLLRGFAFLQYDHDLADAEGQLREALSEKDIANAHLTPDFAKTVTAILALTIAYENRPDEARAMGGPLCEFAADRLGNIHEMMQHKGICD